MFPDLEKMVTEMTAEQLKSTPQEVFDCLTSLPGASLEDRLARGLAMCCDTEVNKRDCYGDGDQSKLYDGGPGQEGEKALLMRNIWSVGGGFEPLGPAASPLTKACASGNLDGVRDILEAFPDDESRTKLIERREVGPAG